MNILICRAIALVLTLAAPAAFSYPITIDLTGAVTADGGVYAGYAIGSAVTASFTYDLNLASGGATLFGNFGSFDAASANGDPAPMISSTVLIDGANIAGAYAPGSAFSTGVTGIGLKGSSQYRYAKPSTGCCSL